MSVSKEEQEHIVEVFRAVHALNEDAKDLKASANDALGVLSQFLDKEKSKQSAKVMKKAVARQYKGWVAKQKGEAQHIEVSDEIGASLEIGEEL